MLDNDDDVRIPVPPPDRLVAWIFSQSDEKLINSNDSFVFDWAVIST